MEASIYAVEKILNYRFRNKRLLEEALTHPSVIDSASYQRLEFIGDAALGLAFSNHLFLMYPDIDPAELTRLRAANVSTEKLARVAVRHKLYWYVRRNVETLDHKVEEFSKAVILEEDAIAHGGSIKAPKVLADIVESVAAAVYIDVLYDLKEFWLIFIVLLEPIVTLEDLQKQPQPVTMLYEFCQKRGLIIDIRYEKTENVNYASVYIDRKFVSCYSAEQKETAKLNAARVALDKLLKLEATDCSVDGIDETKGCYEIQGAKRQLNDLCTKKKWPKPTYNIEKDEGPPHDKIFMCSVHIPVGDYNFCMIGDEKRKVKDAENSAASSMIHALRKSNCL